MVKRTEAEREALARELAWALEEVASGRLLVEIAEELGLPRKTLHTRLTATPELAAAYARARDDGHDARAEKLAIRAQQNVERTANGSLDSAAVQQLRLQIDTEKWLLAKVAPRKYGEKLAIGGAEDLPPVKTETTLDPSEAYKRLLKGEA